MDKTLQVIRRFVTKEGEFWPVGSWIYIKTECAEWWTLARYPTYPRMPYHLSEAEANYLGIYRKE